LSNELYYPTTIPLVKICKPSPDGRHKFIPPSINCEWCNVGSVIVGNEVLYVPTEKGVEYHQRTEENVLFYGGRGSAKSTTGRWDAHIRALSIPDYKYVILRRTFPELEKACSLDTLIPTPNGMKTMGTLEIGDQVFAPDGSPTTIIGMSVPKVDVQGTYKITFDNKESFIVSAGHLWVTSNHRERSGQQRIQSGAQSRTYINSSPKIRTTQEIFNTLKVEDGLRANHSIPIAKPWQTQNNQPLPINPYVLGVWLGDGSSDCGAITSNDPEIFEHVVELGYTVRKQPSNQYGYGILRLQKQLRLQGLLNKKHIPAAYLISSYDNRLALLQGLLDTDGHGRKDGLIGFYNSNKNLAYQVLILVSSLGFKPNITEYQPKLNGSVCQLAYKVEWTSSLPLFRLPRKLKNLETYKSTRITRLTTSNHYIIGCEQVEDTICKCIAVEHPSHQYLIGYTSIPTHNTHLYAIPREAKLLGASYNQTKHILTYSNGSAGFFSHCNTEEDVLNLLGGEFYLALFDEVSTFEWEHFRKLASSVRAPVNMNCGALVRALTNPMGMSAQKIQEYFIDKTVDPEEDRDYNPADWYAIKANLEDNPYLPIEYKKRFSGLPAHVRKAWVDGEFSMENALFDFKPTLEGKPYHVTPELDLPKILKYATVYRAIDSGWFPDPTVVLWIAHLGNRHIVFNEKIWYKTTATQVAEDIKDEDIRLGVFKVAITYCDPSMDINTTADIRTIKEIYEINGIPMECSINKRDVFASAIHNVLAEEAGENLPRIQFFAYGHQGCPYLVRTLPQMRYDQKRPEFMADHKDDHAVVALAYYVMSHASDERRSSTEFSGPKPWMKPKTQERYVLGSNNVRTRVN